MYINCPSCHTKYDIPAEAIGPEGRNVRCKSCGHTWHQESLAEVDEDLLDDLRQLAPDYDKQNADGDAVEQGNEMQMPSGIMPPREEAAPDFKTLLKTAKDEGLFNQGKPNKRAVWNGVIAASIVFLICVVTFFMMRVTFVQSFPPLLPIYELSGFAIDEAGEGLAFDRLQATLADEGDEIKVHITGSIINLTKTEKAIPLLQAKIMDAEEKPVGRFVFAPPSEKIAGEDMMEFTGSSTVETNTGQSVTLGFLTGINK
ncbi:MAG: hypothetical protein GC136_03855 [Alphaproteobacteria bacterium]|nr:hypothetical protein [Alphaproteobacteria bacterium]